MAAGASYPANISTPGPDDDPGSRVAFDGFVNFTDDTDQPAPGDVPFLPTGWTEDDADPANVSGGAGSLSFDDGTGNSSMNAEAILVESDTGGDNGEQYYMILGEGVVAQAPAGVPAFSVLTAAGGTVAFDGGGLLLTNAVPDHTFVWVTVQSGAPSTYLTPLVFDSTAVSGGLYAWDGTAYQQVGGPLA